MNVFDHRVGMQDVNSNNNNHGGDQNLKERLMLMEQMVHRLNGALSKSQAIKTGFLDKEDRHFTEGDVPNWQCDPNILFPLVKEYDQQIEDLTHNNELVARKNEEYEDKIKELMGANDVLMSELRESVENHIGSCQSKNRSKHMESAAEKMRNVKEKLAHMLQKVDTFAQNSTVCDSMNEDFISNLNEAVTEHQSEMKRQDYESQMKVLTRKITKLTQRNEGIRRQYLSFARENEQLYGELKQNIAPRQDGTKELVEKLNILTVEHRAHEQEIKGMEHENVLLVKEVEMSAIDLNIASAAYNEEVQKMNNRIAHLERKQSKLQNSAQQVRRDNSNLVNEMKQLLSQMVDYFHSADPDSDLHPAVNSEAVENLTRQLELCREEKDWAIQLQEDTMQELDNLRRGQLSETAANRRKQEMTRELQSRNQLLEQSTIQFHKDQETLQHENQNLSVTVTRQFDDIKGLKEEARKNREMANMCGKREQDVLEIAEQLKMRVLKLEDERGEMDHRIEMGSKRITELEETLCDTESKLCFEVQKSSQMNSEMKGLHQRLSAMHKTKSECETKEFHYLSQIREGAQLLDGACLARDAAIVREKQLREDLRKSSDAMEKLVQDVARRIQLEVNKCKQQAQEKMNRLMDEIETMTIEAANLKSEVNRARRATKNVESELENRERRSREGNDHNKLVEFQRRTIAAERAKEDLEVTLESFECQYKQRIRDYEDEKSDLIQKQQILEDKTTKLKGDIREISARDLELVEELDRYKSNVMKYENEARTCGLAATKKLAVDRSAFEWNSKQLQNQIKSLNTQNIETTRHFRKLVNDQQRISAKWKEEACNSNQKHDRKIQDLQEKLTVHRRKCQELTIQLQDSTKENQDRETTIRGMESKNKELRERLYQSKLSSTRRMDEQQEAKYADESMCLFDYK